MSSSTRHIFVPLKSMRTRYVPPLAARAGWIEKIAPTQYDENEHMLRGWCMILQCGEWGVWRGRPDYFLLEMIWRSLLRHC